MRSLVFFHFSCHHGHFNNNCISCNSLKMNTRLKINRAIRENQDEIHYWKKSIQLKCPSFQLATWKANYDAADDDKYKRATEYTSYIMENDRMIERERGIGAKFNLAKLLEYTEVICWINGHFALIALYYIAQCAHSGGFHFHYLRVCSGHKVFSTIFCSAHIFLSNVFNIFQMNATLLSYISISMWIVYQTILLVNKNEERIVEKIKLLGRANVEIKVIYWRTTVLSVRRPLHKKETFESTFFIVLFSTAYYYSSSMSISN